jgi:hypothetical protein
MRIAIALTGVSQGQGVGTAGADRNWTLTKDSVKANVIDCFRDTNTVSTYLTTYSHSTINELVEFYKPNKTVMIPYEGSHPRITRLHGMTELLYEDVDFIILTRFDINFYHPINTYNWDYNKFNFVFREIEPYWSLNLFVGDCLFGFPKRYLTTFIESIRREHSAPYRNQPDLHPVYRHVSDFISNNEINFLHQGCYNSNGIDNPFYNLVRA